MKPKTLLSLSAAFSKACHAKLDTLPTTAPVSLQIIEALLKFERATVRAGSAAIAGPGADRAFVEAALHAGFTTGGPGIHAAIRRAGGKACRWDETRVDWPVPPTEVL